MNMTQMMQAAGNPSGFIMQQAVQNMIRENPAQWKAAQDMFNGKNKKQQIAALQKLYRDKGMDLNSVAAQWGIQL